MELQTNIEKTAVDLYWLAFLLTGRRDISVNIAVDIVSDDSETTFFSDWMRNWQRRLAIGKALAAIHNELAESARQTERASVDGSAMPPRGWSLSPDTTKADLEQALLAIDLFPRAALLLLVFERIRFADAATLLDASPDLLKRAQAIGLRELTARIAGSKASADSAPPQRKCGMKRIGDIPQRFFDSIRTVTVCG